MQTKFKPGTKIIWKPSYTNPIIGVVANQDDIPYVNRGNNTILYALWEDSGRIQSVPLDQVYLISKVLKLPNWM